ncbi:MAG: hypothetical protein SOX38_09295 [Candidatus Limiplasma sp.]|nr:hypothetical protein [Candidatus Limiplasma sp.]
MTETGRQMQGDRTDPERIIAALRELRSPFALYEQDIHQAVARRLTDAGLPFLHEKPLTPGCRIDFWCEGVGIEIKKGKPRPAALLEQLRRYAISDEIAALVVLTQRSVRLPASVCGKPLVQITLNQLWGVALP